MALDRMEWLGCDVDRCPAEITGPSRRLTDDARAAGWVHQRTAVWRTEDEAGEDWSHLCPNDAAEAYTRWAGQYADQHGTAPWPAALAEAKARVSTDIATPPSRADRRGMSPEIEADDTEPVTVLTAVVLLLGGWLLLPEICKAGARVAEVARPRRWPNPAAITLPGPALAELGTQERKVLEQLRTTDGVAWRRWEGCLHRVLDDRSCASS